MGNLYDDFVGCDSVLGLAFAYNREEEDVQFAAYGLKPGVVGYDVLLGPAIPAPGYTAWKNGRQVVNYKNLQMTSFNPMAPTFVERSGEAYSETEASSPLCDEKFLIFNLIRGFKPTYDIFSPQPQLHLPERIPTFFPLNGDPITGSGDLDGQNGWIVGGDRKFYVNIGPFTFVEDDTQEIHIGIMAGEPGESRLDAFANLKETDRTIQTIADDFFHNMPAAPPSPKLIATAFPDKIILDWGEDNTWTRKIEETIRYDSDSTAYRFEGYIVYQLADDDQKIPIAVFDVVNGVKTIYGWQFVPELGAKSGNLLFREMIPGYNIVL